jgi:hypothetical protein
MLGTGECSQGSDPQSCPMLPRGTDVGVRCQKAWTSTVGSAGFRTRRVWRYQRGNQSPYIEEEQTTQWPKEKVQKDKQRSTNHTYKTKDRVARTLQMRPCASKVMRTLTWALNFKIAPHKQKSVVKKFWQEDGPPGQRGTVLKHNGKSATDRG